MTKNNISEDGHKDFVTQFRAITSGLHKLTTEFGNNFDSLSSEKELANFWNLYDREEDETI